MGIHGIDLANVLPRELMILDYEPFEGKEQLFQFMSEQFAKSGIVSDKEAFLRALLAREKLGSTYMGDFIAIPHGQCKEVLKPGIGFIRFRESFIYKSQGEEGSVKYIFLLAVDDSGKDNQHLRILATLSGYLMRDDFLELIEHVQSYEELLQGIQEIEKEEIECM